MMGEPPDDRLLLPRLSYRIKSLEEYVATLELAHDQLDEKYCRLEGRGFDLQDQVDSIPAMTERITELQTQAGEALRKAEMQGIEAGNIRDEKQKWKTKASTYGTLAAWAIVIAVIETIAIGAAGAHWYFHR